MLSQRSEWCWSKLWTWVQIPNRTRTPLSVNNSRGQGTNCCAHSPSCASRLASWKTVLLYHCSQPPPSSPPPIPPPPFLPGNQTHCSRATYSCAAVSAGKAPFIQPAVKTAAAGGPAPPPPLSLFVFMLVPLQSTDSPWMLSSTTPTHPGPPPAVLHLSLPLF